MATKKETDKRQYIRLKAYHLARYRVLTEENASSAPSVIATIRDIGAGGVCLRTDESLPLGGLLELNINFPNVATSVFALARIVWVRQLRKAKRFEIGAQFIRIEDSVRLIIDDQIRTVFKRLKTQSGR